MQSYEALRCAAEKIGVKALAARLRVSAALVYKWCEAHDPGCTDTSGTRNPLDRVAEIVEATKDIEVVNWICNQAGGFFVPNPPASPGDPNRELIATTQRLIGEFSRLLATVTRSIEDDGRILPNEAERIRRAWELLKSTVESFTVACECGLYGPQTPPPEETPS